MQATWLTALNHCKARGWRLAAITSKQENDQLLKQIKNSGIWFLLNFNLCSSALIWIVFFLWLGLKYNFWTAGIKHGTDIGNHSKFYWMGHDAPITFTDWHEGEPNNPDNNDFYCINLRPWYDNGSHLWYDDLCGVKFYFVCEESPGKCYQIDCVRAYVIEKECGSPNFRLQSNFIF